MSSRIEQFLFTIVRHLSVAESIHHTSMEMIDAVEKENIDSLELHIGNRERLIKQLHLYQDQIDELAQKLAPMRSPFISEVARNWLLDSQKTLNAIEDTDQKLIKTLQSTKLSTQKQIGSLFKNRKSLSGYNLSSVR